MRYFLLFALALCSLAAAPALQLALSVISYEKLNRNDPETLQALRHALYEEGIVGIRGIPGYSEKLAQFIDAARRFSMLPEEMKEQYSRKPGEMFLGFEQGKEKFKLPNGTWVIDDQKASYYAMIPDCKENKWPSEIDLRSFFQEIGLLMRETGISVMEKIELLSPDTGISSQDVTTSGRMLAYRGNLGAVQLNPFWCGAHFDHGLFTSLLPAFYFSGGRPIAEPDEAGLFIRTRSRQEFQKVAADPDVMLFQVGEFGQLATNDAIRATEHRVQKADLEGIERYTMAAFFNASSETLVFSRSELTSDTRYGAPSGEPCTYQHWHEASFQRYIVE
jgi:isopenicillin N synthase-like dioxygenase